MRIQTKARINESVGKDLLNASLLQRLSSMDLATCVVDASLLGAALDSLLGDRSASCRNWSYEREEDLDMGWI